MIGYIFRKRYGRKLLAGHVFRKRHAAARRVLIGKAARPGKSLPKTRARSSGSSRAVTASPAK
jgi:hypothetical protein